MRDRPDLHIDTLDQNIEMATVIPDECKGERIKVDFKAFQPGGAYDAIWARHALFLLPGEDIDVVVHKLAKSLVPGGIIQFTMMDDCHAATAGHFTGMSREAIETLMRKADLKLVSLELDPNEPYGRQQKKIPTFTVCARKIGTLRETGGSGTAGSN